MASISDHSVVTVSSDLTTAELDGEMVLLDIGSGHYYGVNEVGARILELAGSQRTVEEIFARLVEEYAVSEDRLRRDVGVFLERMEDHELIALSDESDT